jgi:hypothetical protein
MVHYVSCVGRLLLQIEWQSARSAGDSMQDTSAIEGRASTGRSTEDMHVNLFTD